MVLFYNWNALEWELWCHCIRDMPYVLCTRNSTLPSKFACEIATCDTQTKINEANLCA